jgi:Flp pilus assembly protein TadG
MNPIRKNFLRDSRAMATAEFALVLPVLMTLFYGCIEVTRYILITQKVEKLAHSVADVTAQETAATQATLNQVFTATSNIMNPYPTGTNSRIIVSSLYKDVGATVQPTVSWQYAGGGSYAGASAIGAVGAIPAMPGGFTFDDRENVISAEVYYQFSPLLTNRWFGTTTIYRAAFYKPRFGALLSAPS